MTSNDSRTKVSAIQSAADKLVLLISRETNTSTNESTAGLISALNRSEAEITRLRGIISSMNDAFGSSGMMFENSQIWFGPPWTAHYEETSHDRDTFITARRFNEVVSQHGLQSSSTSRVNKRQSTGNTHSTSKEQRSSAPPTSKPVPQPSAAPVTDTRPPMSAPPSLPEPRLDADNTHQTPSEASSSGVATSTKSPICSTASPVAASLRSSPNSPSLPVQSPPQPKPMSAFKSAALASVYSPSSTISPPRSSSKRPANIESSSSANTVKRSKVVPGSSQR